MRRVRLSIATLLALLALGATWLVLGASGQSAPPRVPVKKAERTPAATPVAAVNEQPPLPKARPRVVQPVAGEATEAVATAVPVEEDDGSDRAPTGPASTAPVRARADLAGKDAVRDATALPNGVALPPLEAPEEVMRIIEAGNVIARSPYKWGGGHGRWQDTGYDCSGSVSYALAAAGLLGGPLDSSRLARWGSPGRGRWISVYANAGHVYMEVAGLRFDTSGARRTGSRWQNDLRGRRAGFTVRHPPGL